MSCSTIYSPFLFEGAAFRKSSDGRLPSAKRLLEFQALRESPYAVFKNGNWFQLVIELPGLRQRDLAVNLKRNILTITGTRSYISIEEGSRKRYKFQQSFSLDDDTVDTNNLKADLRDQILTLSVPELYIHSHEVTDESDIEKNYSNDVEDLQSSTSSSS
jgi:HSP20 family molecular chaperone IbpA